MKNQRITWTMAVDGVPPKTVVHVVGRVADGLPPFSPEKITVHPMSASFTIESILCDGCEQLALPNPMPAGAFLASPNYFHLDSVTRELAMRVRNTSRAVGRFEVVVEGTAHKRAGVVAWWLGLSENTRAWIKTGAYVVVVLAGAAVFHWCV